MLRKLAVLPLLILCFVLNLGAQDLTIVDFQSTMNPMTVDMQRRDFNDDICALVKVQLPVSGVAFEGNVVGDTPFKTNEYWVYLTSGTKFLQVKCPGHYPLQIDFRNLGIESLVGKHIYILRLKTAVNLQTPQQTDPGANYLVLDITPKTGLSVRVDGQSQPVEDGMVRVYLKYGTHNYRIEADGYAPAEGMVTISSAGKTTKQIQLESVMAMLMVKPETPECSIFINDAMKGTGTWSGQLNPGLYRIEAKKQGYQSRIENVELFERDNKTLTVPALTPIYGMVNVDYKPIGATVAIDSREVGTTPDMFNNILVGQHTISISKAGYQTRIETFTVREGQETRLTGSLLPEESQQPTVQQGYSAPASQTSGAVSKTFTVNGYSFEMVPVAGGSFRMGWDVTDTHKFHQVSLSDFMIGKFEVTEGLWNAVMGSATSSKGTNYPAGNIDYNKALQFTRRLSQLTGQNFRLPTEAEWEYAARGGRLSNNYKYPGANSLEELGLDKKHKPDGLTEVGLRKPNELGLYDMAGNVYEWCLDWYGEKYYGSSPASNPQGPSKGKERVKRGGYYDSSESFYECGRRFYSEPKQGYFFNGMRLALSGNGGMAPATSAYQSSASQPAPSATVSANSLTLKVNGVSFDIIPVEGCTFTMGSSDHGSTHKTHSVTLPAYGIGKYEVTQDLWRAVMGTNPSYNKNDRYPVEHVSYGDCVEFCKKLSSLTGRKFRLPTEAEWEFAAAGGNKSRNYTYSGSNNLDEVAWYKSNSGGKVHVVGLKKPNELGIYDMSGNIQEWVADWYHNDYYKSSPSYNPQGPSSPDSDKKRSVRGGGYYDDMVVFFKPVRRYMQKPDDKNSLTGFRVAMDM